MCAWSEMRASEMGEGMCSWDVCAQAQAQVQVTSPSRLCTCRRVQARQDGCKDELCGWVNSNRARRSHHGPLDEGQKHTVVPQQNSPRNRCASASTRLLEGQWARGCLHLALESGMQQLDLRLEAT